MAEQSLGERISHAWNAFMGRDPTYKRPVGISNYDRHDRYHVFTGRDKTILTTVITRIAIDASSVKMVHAQLDENENFLGIHNSKLNRCLTVEANIDQGSYAFMRDVITRMLDKGTVAIVPTDTTRSPINSDMYDVREMRAGEITQWYPRDVLIKVYDDRPGYGGKRKEILMPKTAVAIIENPLYDVMNAPNGTYQRLARVLSQNDVANDRATNNKLQLAIKLPYSLKSPTQQERARNRIEEIRAQLSGNEYGIAYIDQAEEVVQLGQGIENQLWQQAKDLQEMLFNELGLTQAIFDGTATEEQLLYYTTKTIEPILDTITQELTRKFISRWSQGKGQRIWYFQDPFKIVPVEKLAQVADTLTRNAILSSNEIRALMGYKPSLQPEADELRNKNIAMSKDTYLQMQPQQQSEQIPGGGEGGEDPGMDTSQMSDEEIQQYMDSLG